jgi:fructose-1,6-bisphosphatase/inositol monophosphatase family enzyme
VRGDFLLEVLRSCADRIEEHVASCPEPTRPGSRPTQLRCDQVADTAATTALVAAGFGVLSEESGARHLDRPVVVVVDPIDGTANLAAGVPWYGPSLCALVDGVPAAAHVRNLADGTRWEAIRSDGATCDGQPAHPSSTESLADAVVATSGPSIPLALGEERRFDAMAFALCSVATGVVDAVVDLDDDHHRCWDLAGGLLVCREAGAPVLDRLGRRDLWPLDPAQGRAPAAAGHPALLAALLAAAADGAPAQAPRLPTAADGQAGMGASGATGEHA